MFSRNQKPSGNSILRMCFVAVALLLQVLWIQARIVYLNQYSEEIAAITDLLSVIVVLKLNGKHTNSAMKMPWIMLILAFPVLGLSLYLMFVLLGDPGVGKRLAKVRRKIWEKAPEGTQETLEKLAREDADAAGQSRYLWNCAGYPVYENTAVTYYGEAVDGFEALKQELEKAERFIFMEYFIVEDASAFRELEEILVRKAKQGVEVRLMYDDIGSIGKVNLLFAKRLNQMGIRCVPFNPAQPLLNLFMNHRDHRKITVIDGRVGFTGGFNLAEEYFGRTTPYGYWKDTAVKLEGEAVRSLTATFLELWSVQTRKTPDPSYMEVQSSAEAQGFVQPFGDDPLGRTRVAEDVYLNMISQAKETMYILTPYLIITDEMTRALTLAAKRGVDVRIITPGIPDKKTVYAVTRSYYAGLASQGVRIFEYSPGFCHAKQAVADRKLAVIGTSNLDYRSLYHHFENNVLLYGCDAVLDIADDFEKLFPQCREMTEKYASGRGAMLRVWQCILRLFAPLM